MSKATDTIEPAHWLLALDARTGQLRERRYELSVIVGPDTGRTLTFDQPAMVGSDPTADLLLTDSTVSRAHLRLVPRADGLGVQDLRSTNGTFVGNARIEEMTLQGESEVRVGKSVLRVRTLDSDVRTPPSLENFGAIRTRNPEMQKTLGILDRAARSSSPILLFGESGVGKEVLARAVHEQSPRAGKPFVVVDCGALAEGIVASELFGHVRGAFTGAHADRVGAFEQASGGTLFLDEIGELPVDQQPKLLRALDTRAIQPVGRSTVTQVDVRIIAATHRNLSKEVESGRFRQELFFRLAVLTVRIPPLRERLEDLPHLIERMVQASGKAGMDITEPLLSRFREYPWPGNIRELRNIVEAALAGVELAPEPFASQGVRPLPPVSPGKPYKQAKDQLVDDFTSAYLSGLSRECGGNISEMSRRSGLARHYLRALLERHGLKAKG
jgi:DNA-binding NtrC family response regulator